MRAAGEGRRRILAQAGRGNGYAPCAAVPRKPCDGLTPARAAAVLVARRFASLFSRLARLRAAVRLKLGV